MLQAVSWCPWQPNVLASGGGTADRHIRFWNVSTGTCLNAVDTKSQVWVTFLMVEFSLNYGYGVYKVSFNYDKQFVHILKMLETASDALTNVGNHVTSNTGCWYGNDGIALLYLLKYWRVVVVVTGVRTVVVEGISRDHLQSRFRS